MQSTPNSKQANGENGRREDHAIAGGAMSPGGLVVSAVIGLLCSHFIIKESG
jgi:hypothetical protein